MARVCVVGGFAYSDVDRAGMSVLAVYDADAQAAAQDVVDATVADITEHATEFAVARDDAEDRGGAAHCLTSGDPVFLADVADNIGGGSPGDGTVLLRELLAAGATGAVVTIADREVALTRRRLGAGADIDVMLGRQDRPHARRTRCTSAAVSSGYRDGMYRTAGYYMTGRSSPWGRRPYCPWPATPSS